jgi:hypothetical protein
MQLVHESVKFVSPLHRPPLLPGKTSGARFCYRLGRHQVHNAAGWIKSMKKGVG